MVNKRFGELIGVSEGIAFGNGDAVGSVGRAVQKEENRIKTHPDLSSPELNERNIFPCFEKAIRHFIDLGRSEEYTCANFNRTKADT